MRSSARIQNKLNYRKLNNGQPQESVSTHIVCKSTQLYTMVENKGEEGGDSEVLYSNQEEAKFHEDEMLLEANEGTTSVSTTAVAPPVESVLSQVEFESYRHHADHVTSDESQSSLSDLTDRLVDLLTISPYKDEHEEASPNQCIRNLFGSQWIYDGVVDDNDTSIYSPTPPTDTASENEMDIETIAKAVSTIMADFEDYKKNMNAWVVFF